MESKQPLISPIKVVYRSISKNSEVAKHSHEWGQFVYAHEGVMLVITDTDRLLITPEKGVWVTPAMEHQVTAVTDVVLTSFYFSQEVLEILPKQSCVLSVGNFLKTLIFEARNVNESSSGQEANRLLLKLILYKISEAQVANFNVPLPRDTRLLTMLERIIKEPSNKLTLNEWGHLLGASKSTLARLYKQETGLNYAEWRKRLTLQLAISQLAAGDTISNISMSLGYSSHSAFSYVFKQITGLTPSSYRDYF